MSCQGATALAGGFRACAGDFFALAVYKHLRVLVSRCLMRRCWAAAEHEAAGVPGWQCTSRYLIPGCSHYALEVKCTSRAGGARLKVSCSLYDLWLCYVMPCLSWEKMRQIFMVQLFMRILVRPGIRNLRNSNVGHLCTASAKKLPAHAIKTPASVLAPWHLMPNQ
jgi:hypothetical protein